MNLARARRAIVYVASFGLGRGTLFAAPILLASLLPAHEYGTLETAQAAASLANTLAALGTASVIPLVLLGHSARTRLAPIISHHLVVVALCLMLAVAGWLGGIAIAWPLSALFTAAATLQSLGSTHLRTLGRSEASVLLEAGLFGVMAMAAGLVRLCSSTDPMPWILGTVVAYVLLQAAVYANVLRRHRLDAPSIARPWRAALAMGVPLMLGSVVSLIATTSGRLGMGILAGPVVTADYAVLARAAALPIVAHQLVVIASFRNLFTLSDEAVTRLASRIVLLVAGAALGFGLAAPWLQHLLGPAFVSAFTRHRLPALAIVAQAVLWCAIALNDLMISRKQVMPRILPASIGFLALALATGWAVLRAAGPTLPNFVYAHAVVMFLFYLVQSAAMRANGIRLERLWFTAAGGYLALIALVAVLPHAFPAFFP